MSMRRACPLPRIFVPGNVSRGVPWRPKTGVLTQIPSVPIRDVPHPWLELIKRFLGGVKFKAAFPLN